MPAVVAPSKPVGRKALPTPPDSDDGKSTGSSDSSDSSPTRAGSLPSVPTRPRVGVLDIDKKTPDAHVPRDPRLIRLTGVHPFNCEAPLTDLFNEGFLTSPELFYVRNHGPVPQVLDADVAGWEISVEGRKEQEELTSVSLVEKPFTITFADLLEKYEQVTYPITLVCAGNRRKEQNQVRKSKGFSWGPAGLSTALFTGCAMSDLIRAARPMRRARWVCMEGADKLPNGYYGTSVKLNWVMDPNRGIMLAHRMNGDMLTPDHGRPIRAVVPGQIGGRSVKWLKKIIVTAEPSDNWYHIYDNRVLPTQVSPEESAANDMWWRDERYAIYGLNNNSAVAYPAHDERLSLKNPPQTYRVRGYAYGGDGRRIARAEVTLDQGKTWRLANVDYPEDAYRDADEGKTLFGGTVDVSWRETSFCWCFWDVEIPVDDLRQAKDIMVRTMDESLNIQPRDMYWSVLGMMNNPWFRVAIIQDGDSLRFEHPTQPALMPGGWMERVKKEGGDLTNGMWGERLAEDKSKPATPPKPAAEIKLTRDDVKRSITIDELRAHSTEKEPWFVVNGEVFDGTPFLEGHPGGAQSIISAAALDSTDEFMAIHSETAKAMMPKYHLGSLDEKGRAALAQGEVTVESSEPRPVFLDSRSWTKAILESKTAVSWDSRIFTYKLEHPEQQLGLPTGQHLMMRLRDPVTREAIIRSYTPISEQAKTGYVDVLIKIYFDCKERAGGKMSQAMEQLPLGHFVDFKGPIGKFQYLGRGKCSVNGTIRSNVREFVMICGGSGITPIYQVFRAVMRDRADETRCTVLNGNRQIEDILCKDELKVLAEGNGHKCHILHTLTQAPEDWKGLRGRIGKELLNLHAVRCDRSTRMALICGPPALEKSAHQELKSMGWKDEDMLFF